MRRLGVTGRLPGERKEFIGMTTTVEQRLDRIERMLEQLLRQSGTEAPPVQSGFSSPDAARLNALARRDRSAAIAEAKRLSREYTARKKRRNT